MKKILIYTLVPVLALLSGCIKDDRNNFMVDDTITLTAESSLQDVSCHTGTFSFGVAKSGKGQSAAKAVVTAEGVDALVAAFNEEQRKLDVKFQDVEIIPSDKYTLEGGNLSWAASDFVKTVQVKWDPAVMAAYIGEKQNCAIALAVRSADLSVSESKRLMLIRMLRSSVSVKQTLLSYTVNKMQAEPSAGGTPVAPKVLTFDLEMDNAIKHVGLTVPVAVDNSLIAEFNSTQEKTFEAAPEGLFSLDRQEVVIAESGRSQKFTGKLDYSALLTGGKLLAFPGYVIPVRINPDGVKATRNGEVFDLKGLLGGNTVVYITVEYEPVESGGVTVLRKWGKFSTAAAAWNEYYGGTPDTDRNVAMDDEYIYLAETGNVDAEIPHPLKNIWAISMADPGRVKKLSDASIKSEGTFYVSCPRVIKNTDASVNGGKDVLVVSNMISGNPTFYFYVDGIDAEPKVITSSTWASRRLGDTFTFAGTLQKGVFFFKDQASAEGTVTFPLSYQPTTVKLNLSGRVIAPATNGVGAYFPFPDPSSKWSEGVVSVRGGGAAQIVKTTVDFNSVSVPFTPTVTNLSGYYTDCAFRFFEFGGRRYVAYTRQVSAGDGRLFLIDGQTTDSWETILKDRHVVYQAAIQSDQENLADYDPSPLFSGNSGMDLDVREIGGDVYIVVLKQHVGLSLFQLIQNEE